jgi:hypothetical protein
MYAYMHLMQWSGIKIMEGSGGHSVSGMPVLQCFRGCVMHHSVNMRTKGTPCL